MKLRSFALVSVVLCGFCLLVAGCGGGSDQGMITPASTSPLPPEDAPAGEPGAPANTDSAPPAPSLPQ